MRSIKNFSTFMTEKKKIRERNRKDRRAKTQNMAENGILMHAQRAMQFKINDTSGNC